MDINYKYVVQHLFHLLLKLVNDGNMGCAFHCCRGGGAKISMESVEMGVGEA